LVIEVQSLVQAVEDPDQSAVRLMVENESALEISSLEILVTFVWVFLGPSPLGYIAFLIETESLYSCFLSVLTLLPLIQSLKMLLTRKMTIVLSVEVSLVPILALAQVDRHIGDDDG